MENELAKAYRRWTEKKGTAIFCLLSRLRYLVIHTTASDLWKTLINTLLFCLFGKRRLCWVKGAFSGLRAFFDVCWQICLHGFTDIFYFRSRRDYHNSDVIARNSGVIALIRRKFSQVSFDKGMKQVCPAVIFGIPLAFASGVNQAKIVLQHFFCQKSF